MTRGPRFPQQGTSRRDHDQPSFLSPSRAFLSNLDDSYGFKIIEWQNTQYHVWFENVRQVVSDSVTGKVRVL